MLVHQRVTLFNMSLNNGRNFPEGNLEMDVGHKLRKNDEQREDHPPFYMTFVDDLSHHNLQICGQPG